MGSFIGGALGGYASESTKLKQAGKQGLLRRRGGKGAADKALSDRVKSPAPVPADIGAAIPGSYRRGGKVKKGGLARVHAGERVLTKKQQSRMRRPKSRRGGAKR